MEYRRAVRPSIIVTLAKYIYNREIIEILLTFILHLKRLDQNDSYFSEKNLLGEQKRGDPDTGMNYNLLTPADKLPQNPPKVSSATFIYFWYFILRRVSKKDYV